MAGVTMALATYAIFVALIQFDNASGLAGLPNPYMTIDSNEKLLKLNCTPQASAIGSWNKVWDLFIFASVQGHGKANVTVAKLTDSEKGPELGGEFKTTAALLGGLLPKDSLKPFPYLSVYVVLQAANYGTYYCEIRHNTELTPNVDPTYSKKVIVRDTVTVTQGNIDDEFDAKITTVVKVNITWQHPRLSKFTEAIVTRTLVDREGRETSPTESLAVVFGADVHKNPETALVVLQDPQNVQGHNYTLTAYVLPVACVGKPCPVQFSCYVPYKDCYGDSEQFCSCTPAKAVPPVSASLSSGTVAGITVAAVLVFMAALLAGLLGLLVCCRQKDHCTKLRSALISCCIEDQVVPEKGDKETQTAADTSTDANNTTRTNRVAFSELTDLRYGSSGRGSADISINRPTRSMQTYSEETWSKQPYKNAAAHSRHKAKHHDFTRNSNAAKKLQSGLSSFSGSGGGSPPDNRPRASISPVQSPREATQPDCSMYHDVREVSMNQIRNPRGPRDQAEKEDSAQAPKTIETDV